MAAKAIISVSSAQKKTLPVSQRSRDKYQELWDRMIIRPEHEAEVIANAKVIIKYRRRFEICAEYMGGHIPWYFLGLLYFREEGCRFKGHAHNGNSLRFRTVDVPAGRPLNNPKDRYNGYTFEESMIDLIILKGYDKVSTTRWPLVDILYYLEANNGFGYVTKGVNSPYLWSYTNHYSKGLFVADHKYDPDKINQSAGCAPVLLYLTDRTKGLV